MHIRLSEEVPITHPDGAVLVVTLEAGVAGQEELHVILLCAFQKLLKFHSPNQSLLLKKNHLFVQGTIPQNSPFLQELVQEFFCRVHWYQRWERASWKCKKDLATIIVNYKTGLQNAKQYILKNAMKTALTLNVRCLQHSKHKVTAEKMANILSNFELMNRSKHSPRRTCPVRHKNFAIWLPRHYFDHSAEGDTRVLSWFRTVSELQYFSNYIRSTEDWSRRSYTFGMN